jgi:predicted DNA-binding WGR domain protein
MMTHAAYLEARDPARNIYRAYCIDYGQDLFDNWIVEVTYGRIGSKGCSLIVVVKD